MNRTRPALVACALAAVAALDAIGCGGGSSSTVTVSEGSDTASTAATSTTSSGLTQVSVVTTKTVNDCLKNAGFDSTGVKTVSGGVNAAFLFSPAGAQVSVAVLDNPGQASQLADTFAKQGDFTVQTSADGRSVILSKGDLSDEESSAIDDCTTPSG